jgi:chemotaxis protein methyltransferase CheR
MTAILTPDEFQFIADLLKQRSGLALTPDKGYLLDTRLTPIAKANGMADLRELVAKLRANPSAPLAYQVFRDTKPFEQLSKVILPALKARGATSVRIWSAACSTGQEAYSIAMTLKEESAKYPTMKFEIYGTDLAEKVLERARAGIYSQFEIQRGLPITMLMKYFTQRANNNWEINDTIKPMAKFATGNLLLPFVGIGKFDIIFCRNVLIYFDEKTKSEVMGRLAAAMNAPGYLFLGTSETTNGLCDKFKVVEEHRGMFTLA